MSDPPRPDDALSDTTSGSQLATALEEYLEAAAGGEPPDRSLFLAEYPELADELRRCLESLDFIRNASLDAEILTPQVATTGRKPEVLGDFRLIEEIGRGGMGVVYRAEQRSLGRQVAVKVLPFAALLDRRQLERFKNEARAAAMLKHPHIVSVHSVGQERGVHFYAMELIDGMSLAEVIEQGRLGTESDAMPRSAGNRDPSDKSPDQIRETTPLAALSTQRRSRRRDHYRSVARLGIQAADAVQFAHQEGVIHRDLKPSNLLLDTDGKVYVTDFGLARIQAAEDLTLTGDIVGTLRYMSPEQLDSTGYVDPRTDVYALGVTLYELLCGCPAFPGTNRRTIEQQILDGQFPRPRSVDPRIPRDLETILLKAAARDAPDRYRSAGELADDLRRFTANQPIQARRTTAREKLLSWVRRNRRVSALVATVVSLLMFIAVAASMLALKFARDAREYQLASHARVVRIAQNELERGNLRAARRNLLQLVPATGETDLRGLPWYWLWDQSERRAAKATIHHLMAVGGVGWSGDGRQLAACAWETLKVCDPDSGQLLWKTRDDVPQYFLARLPTSGEWVTGTDRGEAILRDVSNPEQKTTIPLDLPVDQSRVRTVSESADGRYLAIAASAEARYGSTTPAHVWVWDRTTGQFAATLGDGLVGRAFAGFTENALVAGSFSGKLDVYDDDTWELVRTLDCEGMVSTLAVSADRQFVATAAATGRGQSIRSHLDIWNAITWQSIARLHHPHPIMALAFSNQGHRLSAGDSTGRLITFETATTKPVMDVRLHNGAIHAIAYSPDDRYLATGGEDNVARVWDVAALIRPTGPEALPTTHNDSIYQSGWLDNGTACSVDNSGHVMITDLGTGDIISELTLKCPQMRHSMVCIAPGKNLIAVARQQWPINHTEGLVAIVDTSNRTQPVIRHRLSIPEGVLCGPNLAFSPDAELLAVGGNRIVAIHATATGERLQTLPCPEWVKSVAWSPDGNWLVVGCAGGEGVLFRAGTWELQRTMNGDGSAVMDVAFSPDASCFATVGRDGAVRLWQVPDCIPCDPRFGSTDNWLLHVEFSPDGRHLLTSGKDGVLRIWMRESGEELLSLPLTYAWLTDGSFSPDGHAILAAANTDLFLLRTNPRPFATGNAYEPSAISSPLRQGATP